MGTGLPTPPPKHRLCGVDLTEEREPPSSSPELHTETEHKQTTDAVVFLENGGRGQSRDLISAL